MPWAENHHEYMRAWRRRKNFEIDLDKAMLETRRGPSRGAERPFVDVERPAPAQAPPVRPLRSQQAHDAGMGEGGGAMTGQDIVPRYRTRTHITIHPMREPDMTFTGFIHAAMIALVSTAVCVAIFVSLAFFWIGTP